MQTQLIWSFSKSRGSPFPLKDLLYTDTHHMGCFQMFCSKHIATKHKYHYIYQWQPLHRDLLHLYILYLTPKQTKFWCDTFVSHTKRTKICVVWIITHTSCVQQIRTIQLQCCVQQRRPLSSNLYFIIISKKETKNISLLQQHTSHSSTWTTLVSHTIGSIHILFKHWKTKQTNKQTNKHEISPSSLPNHHPPTTPSSKHHGTSMGQRRTQTSSQHCLFPPFPCRTIPH